MIQTVAECVLPILLNGSTNRSEFIILIRMITFWKLDIRHTCCDMETFRKRIRDDSSSDMPIGTYKPEPFYSPKDTKRIHHEDRYLIATLERLVPELDQAYDDLGQPFDVFVESHMLPRIDEELKELAKEDHELFSEGRRDLGVIMEPMLGHVSDEEAESGDESVGKDGEEQDSGDEYDV